MKDDALHAPRAHEPPVRRLPVSYGLGALLVGFLAAQLAGKLTSDVVNALAAGSGETSALSIAPPMLASELALMLVALLTPLILSLPLRESLGLRGAKPVAFLLAAIGTVALGPLGDVLMTQFARFFPKLTLGVVPTLHDLAARLPLYVIWPSFALLPGIAEELLFRGVLQGSLGRNLRSVAIAGVAFALFHVDPVHVVGVLPLGLFLSWVAYRSSTSVTIFAHVSNNSLAVLSIHSAMWDVGYGTGREMPLSMLIGSSIVFACAAWGIVQATRARAG